MMPLAFFASLLVVCSQAPQRRPVPVPSRQAEIRRDLEDILEGRRKQKNLWAENAKKYIEECAEVDADTRYVLLLEGRALAIGVNDLDVLAESIDLLVDEFSVSYSELWLEALDGLDASDDLARWAVLLADELLDRGSYRAALDLINARVVRKAVSRAGSDEVDSAIRRLRDVEHLEEVVEAYDALEKEPNDSDASAVVGRWLFVFRGDTKRSFLLLAQSSDKALRDLARLEVTRPSLARDMLALADQWLQAAGTSENGLRQAALERAQYWYEQAEPLLEEGTESYKVRVKLDMVAQELRELSGEGVSSAKSDNDSKGKPAPNTTMSARRLFPRRSEWAGSYSHGARVKGADVTAQVFSVSDDVIVLDIHPAPGKGADRRLHIRFSGKDGALEVFKNEGFGRIADGRKAAKTITPNDVTGKGTAESITLSGTQHVHASDGDAEEKNVPMSLKLSRVRG